MSNDSPVFQLYDLIRQIVELTGNVCGHSYLEYPGAYWKMGSDIVYLYAMEDEVLGNTMYILKSVSLFPTTAPFILGREVKYGNIPTIENFKEFIRFLGYEGELNENG